MKPSNVLAVVGCAAVLFAATPSAFAQRGGGGGGGHGGGHMGGGGFGGGHMGGGGFGGGRIGGGGHMGTPVIRGGGGPAMPRGGFGRVAPMGPLVGSRGFGGVRGAVGTSGVVGGRTWTHGGGFVRGGFGGPFVHNGAVVRGPFAHGFHAAPVHFFRPYYAFHPRVSLGFGIWAGYPFGYPYRYYYPYIYPDAYVNSYTYPAYDYTYPAPTITAESVLSGSAGSQPDQTNVGGMSFDITPATAEVFVDGTLVGVVGDFTPTTQPLGLPAGRHHVEVRAAGYHTMTFEVDIVAGQVIPYQGTLERE
jgi:hypothetical protein